MTRLDHSRNDSRRRGFVLLAVLVVVVLLSLAAYQFSELMTAEYRSADSASRTAQARVLAEGGIDYAIANLTNPTQLGQQLQAQSTTSTGTSNSSGSSNSSEGSGTWTPPNFIHNPTLFQGIAVGTPTSGHPQGYFSIVSRIGPDEIGNNSVPFHFGVIDEGGKINLNAIMQIDPSGQTLHDMLMALQPAVPNLTEDVVNSILDWIDTDDTPRTNGAEDDTYQGMTPAYHAKNGPLDSLEEMLMIHGVTPSLLLGNDRNRNGVLDQGEDDGSGQVNYGLSAYVTVYSRELNISSSGTPRIYINANDLNQLQTDLGNILGQDLANYIVNYRKYGPIPTGGGEGGSGQRGSSSGGMTARTTGRGGQDAASSGAIAARTTGGNSGGNRATPAPTPAAGNSSAGNGGGSGGGGRRISSLFELVGSSVSVPGNGPGAQATVMASPLNDQNTQQQLLPILLDQCTTVKSPELPARININTAPATVIQALPGLSTTDISNILNNRPDPVSTTTPDPTYSTTAWLVTVAGLSPNKLQSLEKYITASTQVYRVQSIGYFRGSGPSARVEAVIDTNGGMPRILFWRDLTDMGTGFDLGAISGQ